MNPLTASLSATRSLKNNFKKGFTLIELMVVIAIIGILAAIAVPSLLQSRISANQSSAIGSLHAINQAQTAYQAIWGNGFGITFAALAASSAGNQSATCAAAALLPFKPWTDATVQKSGYTFALAQSGAVIAQLPAASDPKSCPATATGYLTTAIPMTNNQTGNVTYCSDHTGGIYQTIGSVSSVASVTACEAFLSI